MVFTLSVRSFQMPATSGTSAWPPSLPSTPTSRDTLFTSAENIFRESTIRLIVVESSSTSPPFSSSDIFLERSPFATAVVTAAISLTWVVRLLAMWFTLSVRSFQVPETFGTLACPPSLPSTPTSRATWVTCSAKIFKLSSVRLITSAIARKSPVTVRLNLSSSLPAAILFKMRLTSSTGLAIASIRILMLSIRSFHTPLAALNSARASRLPSIPPTLEIRDTSVLTPPIISTMVLYASASSANLSLRSFARRTEISPSRKAFKANIKRSN